MTVKIEDNAELELIRDKVFLHDEVQLLIGNIKDVNSKHGTLNYIDYNYLKKDSINYLKGESEDTEVKTISMSAFSKFIEIKRHQCCASTSPGQEEDLKSHGFDIDGMLNSVLINESSNGVVSDILSKMYKLGKENFERRCKKEFEPKGILGKFKNLIDKIFNRNKSKSIDLDTLLGVTFKSSSLLYSINRMGQGNTIICDLETALIFQESKEFIFNSTHTVRNRIRLNEIGNIRGIRIITDANMKRGSGMLMFFKPKQDDLPQMNLVFNLKATERYTQSGKCNLALYYSLVQTGLLPELNYIHIDGSLLKK